MVKFSTGLPNCREGRQNPIGSVTGNWMREVASRADALGFHSLWLNEFHQTHPTVTARFDEPPNYYDPICTIAYLVPVTEHIRFNISTVVLPQHEPILLSRQIATLDVLSNGRVTLGVGLGGTPAEFAQMHGEMTHPNRGQMMDGYLEALRSLWSQRKASHDGRYVKFADVESYPKPHQQPLPILMAGDVEGAFRRVALFGQGWITAHLTPEAISTTYSRIRNHLASVGRRDDSIEIARQISISVAESESEAQANLAESLPGGRPVGSPLVPSPDSEVALVGTPESIASRLQDYVNVGVTEICSVFYSPDAAGANRQMQLFAQEVIPRLRQRDSSSA